MKQVLVCSFAAQADFPVLETEFVPLRAASFKKLEIVNGKFSIWHTFKKIYILR